MRREFQASPACILSVSRRERFSMLLIIVVLVLGGFAVYVMTPGERSRALEAILRPLRRSKDRALHRRFKTDPFEEALRARTRWPVVTYALAALNVAIFVLAV